MRLIIGMTLMAAGSLFWVFGTIRLPGQRTFLWKLHLLGISDTFGSALIVAGLLVRSSVNWPLLTLALISLLFWGTTLCFLLARRGVDRRQQP